MLFLGSSFEMIDLHHDSNSDDKNIPRPVEHRNKETETGVTVFSNEYSISFARAPNKNNLKHQQQLFFLTVAVKMVWRFFHYLPKTSQIRSFGAGYRGNVIKWRQNGPRHQNTWRFLVCGGSAIALANLWYWKNNIVPVVNALNPKKIKVNNRLIHLLDSGNMISR